MRMKQRHGEIDCLVVKNFDPGVVAGGWRRTITRPLDLGVNIKPELFWYAGRAAASGRRRRKGLGALPYRRADVATRQRLDAGGRGEIMPGVGSHPPTN